MLGTWIFEFTVWKCQIVFLLLSSQFSTLFPNSRLHSFFLFIYPLFTHSLSLPYLLSFPFTAFHLFFIPSTVTSSLFVVSLSQHLNIPSSFPSSLSFYHPFSGIITLPGHHVYVIRKGYLYFNVFILYQHQFLVWIVGCIRFQPDFYRNWGRPEHICL